jgi:DNA polymerase-1
LQGFEPKGKIFDTLNASRCAYPGEYIPRGDGIFDEADHSLAAAIKRELPEVELPEGAKKKYQQVAAWLDKKNADHPELTEEHAEYAASDVIHLKHLHDALLRRMDALGQRDIYENIELRIQEPVLNMMARGVPVDLASWDKAISDLEIEARALEARLHEILDERGIEPPEVQLNKPKDPAKIRTEKVWKFSGNPNPNSTVKRDALAALEAYGVTIDNTSEKTLAAWLKQNGEDEFVRTLMDFRVLKGVINRQRNFLKGSVIGGRIHCKMATYGSETARIITSHPNLQGLDNKRPVWRSCIRDVSGEKQILSADLDQIELRILARVSGDEELISVYRDQLPDGSYEDLHTSTAKSATGLAKIGKKERTVAKRVNFGIAYGAMPEGIYKRLVAEGYDEFTLEDVQAFFDAFFDRFKQVGAWQEAQGSIDSFDTVNLCGRHRTVSPKKWGSRRGWPNREERLNAPIQSTGADIFKKILIRLSEEGHPHAELILPVHDEVIFEVDKGQGEEVSEWLMRVMTDAVVEVLGEDLAKNVVDVVVGDSWGGDA